MAQVVHGARAYETIHFKGQEVKCQGHVHDETEDRFEGLAEASYSTLFGPV